MNARAWWQLAVLSIRDPAQAAVALLAMRPGRDVLWPALLLAAALNTLVFSLSDILLPAPPVFPPIPPNPPVPPVPAPVPVPESPFGPVLPPRPSAPELLSPPPPAPATMIRVPSM